MKKQLFKLSVVAFAFSGIANANHETKWPATSGSFAGGLGYSWTTGGSSGSNFFVDGLHLKNRFEVSPKLSVVLHNAFAVNSANTGPAAFNESTYFSTATISGGNLVFSNLAAYIQHECSKTLTWAFGHMRTGLGMESMMDRNDMMSYYYSYGYAKANTVNMNYDLGLKFTINDVLPGALEVAVVDGRAGRTGMYGWGLAARWHADFKSGNDTVITPVVSTVLENWRGGPRDIGITAGAMTKFSSFKLNAEWFFIQTGTSKDWHIMAEPGFDLGMFDISVKYNFINQGTTATGGASTTDHMLGAAISKTYDDKYTAKLAYNHYNLGGKLAGGHVNDIRLVFSTKW